MRQFFRNLLNPLMVLTMIAVVSAIAAFLPYAQVHWKTTYAAVVFIAVLGSAALVYQMYGLYYRASTVKQINKLIAEGQGLTLSIKALHPNVKVFDYPSDYLGDPDEREAYLKMDEWCKRVEDLLIERTDDGEGYISRFHFGGSNEQDKRYMTIWKMNHRLETLATFLPELK